MKRTEVAPVKWIPVIETLVPEGPLGGVNDVIAGPVGPFRDTSTSWGTFNGTPLEGVPVPGAAGDVLAAPRRVRAAFVVVGPLTDAGVKSNQVRFPALSTAWIT